MFKDLAYVLFLRQGNPACLAILCDTNAEDPGYFTQISHVVALLELLLVP